MGGAKSSSTQTVWTLYNARMKKATLYCDGGSRGNPGPAASGAVLFSESGERIGQTAKYLGRATNNIAEYTALIIGLEKATAEGVTHLAVRMDSELVVRQLQGRYRVKNPDLAKCFLRVQSLLGAFISISFAHVRREFNTAADALVNETLDRQRIK